METNVGIIFKNLGIYILKYWRKKKTFNANFLYFKPKHVLLSYSLHFIVQIHFFR
jgi:hypothetical protein